MDKSKLITIVVTAVITAIAKELVTWLLSVTKTLSTRATLRAKVKALFSKYNRAVFLDMGFVIFSTLTLIQVLRDKSPVTRFDVFLIVLCMLAIPMSVFALLIDMRRLRRFLSRPDSEITENHREV
jgi:hypothetical protein